MRNPLRPTPAPPGFGEGKVAPARKSSLKWDEGLEIIPLDVIQSCLDADAKKIPRWISKLLFGWLDPFLSVGFSRPLQKEDLWALPQDWLTDPLTDELERTFYQRCPPEKRPRSWAESESTQQRPVSIASTQSTTIADEKRTANDNTVLDEKHASAIDDKNDIDLEENVLPEPGSGDGSGSGSQKQAGKSKTAEKAQQPKHDESLLKSLNRCYFWMWWTAGILTLVANTLQTTTPLVNQRLLSWLEDRYYYWKAPVADRELIARPQGIGYGIGLAFAIFAMQEVYSLMTCHYTLMSMEVGLLVRTSVVGAIYRKSLRLSARSRLEHSVGKITTMISADATRLERNTYYAHNLWVAPIQIAICLALLIKTLGYSALVGLGVFILGFPVQVACAIVMFKQRSKGVLLTDKRVRTVTEVLQGIRLIKFFAWEEFFEHEVSKIRRKEVSRVRKIGLAVANLISVVTIMPILAAVLSFITYGLSGHDLNVSIIFTALQYFNIIRQPLMFFPMVVASCTDSIVALGRISEFLTAEELDEAYTIQPESKFAIDTEGDFTWESAHKPPPEKLPDFSNVQGADKRGPPRPPPPKEKKGQEKKGKKIEEGKRNSRRFKFGWKGKKDEPVLPTDRSNEVKDEQKKDGEQTEERPFQLKDVSFKVPSGSFAVILGPIGSGKSSLMQALIGEMRRTKGHTVLSSSVAYVPQNAWIMNATLRENIVFGREDKEEKFRAVVKACCLERDLEMLPYGEKTEIGEKGINLSGGQKARVSLARAAYSEADIILMDDSLSAIDAHTGKQILDNLFLSGPLSGKTRVLVTHALHVLDKADCIFVMKEGTIIERGSYDDLMHDSVTFSRMIEEYGSIEREKDKAEASVVEKVDESAALGAAKETDIAQPQLMQEEERLTGSVAWKTYGTFYRYAGGLAWAPLLILLVALMQGAQVANNIFLGDWTAESVKGFKQGDYMGTYAALGVATALFSFGVSYSLTVSSLAAGYSMFQMAFAHVMHSSVSFFDTTPIGRIISRLSRDQDTIDAEISMTLFVLLSTVSSVVGTVFLVFYTFPYLGIIFVPLVIFYTFAAVYYRRSSVETKRLDSILRSKLYSAYAESLTGLSTVRAYGEEDNFIKKTEQGLDLENRAYYMVIAIQQWLSTRLDLLGNILVLGIALFAAGFSKTISPSKVGVVLSYTLSITQVFSQVVQTYAQNEQNFNAVERILYYIDLPSEGDYTKPSDPPASWPEKGEIQFKDVDLAYREGLPLVLKQVTFSARPGEKIGIVGRTGAGKSSLMQALFRTVNIVGGSIEIDGVDTRDIGLKTLRSRLALVPQDNVLFKGTLRQNLDPEGTRTDAELISALQRTWLLPKDGTHDAAAEAKFSLDSVVGDDGNNYSAGEKQMLALCRALAKNSRIIVLDEATSNVDLEMDAKLQKTIQQEFAASTLLCIAHRLNTIVYYDRVLLMDAGRVAEFDTPLNLFDKEDSIFRSLCNQAGLSRQDILRIRSNVPASAVS